MQISFLVLSPAEKCRLSALGLFKMKPFFYFFQNDRCDTTPTLTPTPTPTDSGRCFKTETKEEPGSDATMLEHVLVKNAGAAPACNRSARSARLPANHVKGISKNLFTMSPRYSREY